MSSTLGLDGSQTCEDEHGTYVDEESCHNDTIAQELYEIVLLKGLPGAIYICWHNLDSNYEWADIQWGFSHLSTCDWVLHYTASQNSYEDWRRAYYKLSSRNNTKYVRTSLLEDFNQIQQRFARNQE